MKLTIAFLSIIITLGAGACSTAKVATKDVNLATCAPGDAGKKVNLQDPFEPGGRVVRLAH